MSENIIQLNEDLIKNNLKDDCPLKRRRDAECSA